MIKFCGKFYENSQLPEVDLPDNAIQYVESDDMKDYGGGLKRVYLYWTASILLVVGLILHSWFLIKMGLGVGLSLLAMPLHELIHVWMYPMKADKFIFKAEDSMFVTCTAPMSRGRFILMAIMPNIILGIIPIILSILFGFECILYFFGWGSLGGGWTDYKNIWNTLIQTKRGCTVQNSGIHSYWYMSE